MQFYLLLKKKNPISHVSASGSIFILYITLVPYSQYVQHMSNLGISHSWTNLFMSFDLQQTKVAVGLRDDNAAAYTL